MQWQFFCRFRLFHSLHYTSDYIEWWVQDNTPCWPSTARNKSIVGELLRTISCTARVWTFSVASSGTIGNSFSCHEHCTYRHQMTVIATTRSFIDCWILQIEPVQFLCYVLFVDIRNPIRRSICRNSSGKVQLVHLSSSYGYYSSSQYSW